MILCRRATDFTDLEMIEYYQKTCSWNTKSTKTKNCNKLHQIHYAKESFLMVYIGTYDCYENIKINVWSTISILTLIWESGEGAGGGAGVILLLPVGFPSIT